jgi:transcriptional regulator with XRE-family HTH domain
MAYTIRLLDPKTVAFMKAVGRQVFFARVGQGLSQRHLEHLCGVDQTTISRLERGLAPGLRLERLATIMAVLGIGELRPTWNLPNRPR